MPMAPTAPAAVPVLPQLSTMPANSPAFRCRKCRTPLFTASMLDFHEPGGGQMAFKPRKRGSAGHAATGADPCTSHFLLQDAESALHPALAAEDAGDEGDLNCPKCRTRVGSYSWYGMQCACGAWVTPAFQVIKSKVDEAVSTGAVVRDMSVVRDMARLNVRGAAV